MYKIVCFFAIFLLVKPASACSTFCINHNGQIVFGRNYDWITGAGTVNTNQRSLFKTSVKVSDGDPVSWVSAYGSITFNQYGKEFPTGGMNEKGLVVELMWLDETTYPAKDKRPAIGVLQWIQYQLDNAATVAEVVGSDLNVRITATGTPLHYLVADATGKVASIEFLKGKMVVHTEKQLPYPVLTNNTYQSSAQTATTCVKQKSHTRLNDNSLDRYVQACTMIEQIKAIDHKLNLPDFAFSILDKVSQGDYTKWSIVYDISNMKIYFKTNVQHDIKTIGFKGFDFSCNTKPKMFDINQDGKNDITSNFILPDKQISQRIIEQAVSESSSRVKISKTEQAELLNYCDAVYCK